jgi:hypothetical protein
VHGFERQRFQNEHVQSALNEITRLVRHTRIPLEDQEEGYTSPTECQEENHESLHFQRQRLKGRGRSLRYGLSAPPTASQAFIPGGARERQEDGGNHSEGAADFLCVHTGISGLPQDAANCSYHRL